MPKLRVSDRVRVSKYKGKFEKGYVENWSEEMFTIHEVYPSDPPVYRLRDDIGEVAMYVCRKGNMLFQIKGYQDVIKGSCYC